MRPSKDKASDGSKRKKLVNAKITSFFSPKTADPVAARPSKSPSDLAASSSGGSPASGATAKQVRSGGRQSDAGKKRDIIDLTKDHVPPGVRTTPNIPSKKTRVDYRSAPLNDAVDLTRDPSSRRSVDPPARTSIKGDDCMLVDGSHAVSALADSGSEKRVKVESSRSKERGIKIDTGGKSSTPGIASPAGTLGDPIVIHSSDSSSVAFDDVISATRASSTPSETKENDQGYVTGKDSALSARQEQTPVLSKTSALKPVTGEIQVPRSKPELGNSSSSSMATPTPAGEKESQESMAAKSRILKVPETDAASASDNLAEKPGVSAVGSKATAAKATTVSIAKRKEMESEGEADSSEDELLSFSLPGIKRPRRVANEPKSSLKTPLSTLKSMELEFGLDSAVKRIRGRNSVANLLKDAEKFERRKRLDEYVMKEVPADLGGLPFVQESSDDEPQSGAATPVAENAGIMKLLRQDEAYKSNHATKVEIFSPLPNPDPYQVRSRYSQRNDKRILEACKCSRSLSEIFTSESTVQRLTRSIFLRKLIARLRSSVHTLSPDVCYGMLDLVAFLDNPVQARGIAKIFFLDFLFVESQVCLP